MVGMPLDFTPLANAVDRLAEGLARHQKEPGDAQLRDGLIQRFEFTYDLAPKMLRRAIEAAAANPGEIDAMSFATLIRTAQEQGYVAAGWDKWRTYREMRNITSHTYDEAKAAQVVAAIPGFLADVRELVGELQRRAGG